MADISSAKLSEYLEPPPGLSTREYAAYRLGVIDYVLQLTLPHLRQDLPDGLEFTEQFERILQSERALRLRELGDDSWERALADADQILGEEASARDGE